MIRLTFVDETVICVDANLFGVVDGVFRFTDNTRDPNAAPCLYVPVGQVKMIEPDIDPSATDKAVDEIAELRDQLVGLAKSHEEDRFYLLRQIDDLKQKLRECGA